MLRYKKKRKTLFHVSLSLQGAAFHPCNQSRIPFLRDKTSPEGTRTGGLHEIIFRMVVLLPGHLSPGFSRGRHARIAKNNIYGRVQYVEAAVLVPLFAITQVTGGEKRQARGGRWKERETKKEGEGGGRRKQRKEVPSRSNAPGPFPK